MIILKPWLLNPILLLNLFSPKNCLKILCELKKWNSKRERRRERERNTFERDTVNNCESSFCGYKLHSSLIEIEHSFQSWVPLSYPSFPHLSLILSFSHSFFLSLLSFFFRFLLSSFPSSSPDEEGSECGRTTVNPLGLVRGRKQKSSRGLPFFYPLGSRSTLLKSSFSFLPEVNKSITFKEMYLLLFSSSLRQKIGEERVDLLLVILFSSHQFCER